LVFIRTLGKGSCGEDYLAESRTLDLKQTSNDSLEYEKSKQK